MTTFDSVVQYRQVLTGRYADWHPPITAFLWRWLGGARWGGAPMLLLDCALYWTGVVLIAETLRRRGDGRAALAAIFVALLPIPFGQMGAVLKDPLLAACCLATTGLLALGAGRARLAAIPLLVVAGATRFNAVFAVAPLLLACARPDLWRRPRLATLGGLGVAAAAAALASLAISAALKPKATEPIYSLVNFDLAGASLLAGHSVYPTGAEPGMALLGHCYSPRLFAEVDFDRCETVETRLRTNAHLANATALGTWLAGVARAPLAWFEHRAAHFNRNQRWFVSEVPPDAIYIAGEPNGVGLRFDERRAAQLVYRAAMAMAWSPVGRPATWLAAALGLCLLGIGGRLPSLALALAASALCYGSAYALVSVADDMRYNLWTMLAAMLAWVLVVAGVDWEALPRRRRRLAVALPLIAGAGELAGLVW